MKISVGGVKIRLEVIIVVGIILFLISKMSYGYHIREGYCPEGKVCTGAATTQCFDKDTPVVLLDNTTKPFCEVCVGDVLSDGGIVTATLILDARDEDMYNLNGVVVSGTHAVKHNDKWIFVCDHPEANLLEDYTEPHIYCMNTTTKQLTIKNTIFVDWDDIYVYNNVKVIFDKIYEKDYGVVPTSLDYIHEYYDGGFEEDVEIVLESGEAVPINKIPVCATLQHGVSVRGIVKIDKTMIKNTANIYKNKDNPNNLAKNTDFVYHLVTNKGYFYVGENKINDYNYYVDSRNLEQC